MARVAISGRVAAANRSAIAGRVAIPHTQNLCLRSNLFSNAAWVKVNATIGAAVANPITGAIDAETFVDTVDGAPAIHSITEAATPVPAGERDCNYTVRVYAKNVTAGVPIILLAGLWLLGSGTYFNLVAGTKANAGANISSTIAAVGGGWYLCTVTGPSDTTRTLQVISATAGPTVSYQGAGSSCFNLYEVGIAQANGWAGPITHTDAAAVDTGPIRSLP